MFIQFMNLNSRQQSSTAEACWAHEFEIINEIKRKCQLAQSYQTLHYPMVCTPGKNTRLGSHSLLQRIFPTQGSNPGLLHYRQILYCLSHRGSLFLNEIKRISYIIPYISTFCKSLQTILCIIYIYIYIFFNEYFLWPIKLQLLFVFYRWKL